MRPLVLGRGWRTACTVLQIVPIPGVGAMIAGWKNPQSGLLPRGSAQALLVVFGSWPLVVPGAVGLAWAVWDAFQIHRGARPPGPLSRPVPGSAPEDQEPPPKRRGQKARRGSGGRAPPT